MAEYYIKAFIQWILVPAFLLIALILGIILARASSKRAKASANAGILAGLLVFVLFVISQQKYGIHLSIEVLDFSFEILPVAIGFAIGFVLRWLIDFLDKQPALSGIFALTVVASTTISMYSYFLIAGLKSIVMFVALGLFLGALVHMIFFPELFTVGADD